MINYFKASSEAAINGGIYRVDMDSVCFIFKSSDGKAIIYVIGYQYPCYLQISYEDFLKKLDLDINEIL